MKQQILWVVEFRRRGGTVWSFDEVCFSREEARTSAAWARSAGVEARVIKYIRSE